MSSFQHITVIALVALGITAAMQFNKGIVSELFDLKKPWLYMIVFYVLHVSGLIYSSNLKYAVFDLQIKSPLLFIPLIFLANRLPNYQSIKYSFVAGNFFAIAICLTNAIINFKITNDNSVFFHVAYSYFLHPTYFSVYLNISAIFLLDWYFDKNTKSAFQKVMFAFMLALLVINIMLLSSRTATFVFYLSFLVVLFYYLRNVFPFLNKIKFVALFVIFALPLQIISFKLFNRYGQVSDMVMRLEGKSSGEYNSASVRLVLWERAFSVIKDNPILGVGTGDIKDELMKKYAEAGFTKGIEKYYSPHNQLMHTGVILGIIGIVSLLLIFVVPFLMLKKNSFYILKVFLVLFFFNLMTESLIERQAGVVFFTFFLALLYNDARNHNEKMIVD